MDVAAEQYRGRSLAKVDARLCRANDFDIDDRQSAGCDADADAEGRCRIADDSEARQFCFRQAGGDDSGTGIRVGSAAWKPYGRFARHSTHQAYAVLQDHSFTIFAGLHENLRSWRGPVNRFGNRFGRPYNLSI